MSWSTVITSAAVGAFASAIVSLGGQLLERRARRREVLLVKAIDLAVHRTETVKEIALKTGASFELRDTTFLAARYYGALRHLLENDSLPADFINTEPKRPHSAAHDDADAGEQDHDPFRDVDR